MPRYFFHLRDGEDQLLDPDGIELETEEAAAARALKEARGLLGQELQSTGRLQLHYTIEVQTADGRVIYSLPFKDAITIMAE